MSEFGDSDLERYDDLFKTMVFEGSGSTFNVLVVCAYSNDSMCGFKVHICTNSRWPTKFTHMNVVLRAEVSGLAGETKLQETLEAIIAKAEHE